MNVERTLRVTACVVALAVAVGACSEDGSGDGSTVEDGSGVEDETADAAGSAGSSEPADAAQDATSAGTTSSTAVAGTESDERVSFEGVTFAFDATGPVEGADGRVISPGDGTDVVGADRVVFDLALRDDTATGAEVRVVPLSDPAGTDIEISDDDRQRLAELDSSTVTSLAESPGDPGDTTSIDFVNGSGVRTVRDESGTLRYTFVGLTSDDRFLVTAGPIDIPSSAGTDDVIALDSMMSTVYVDGNVGVFAGSACEDDAFLVADLTIPDGSFVESGSEIVKSWRLRNDGTCTWDEGYSWVLGGGDPLTVLSVPVFDDVEPGEEVDVDLRVRVPEEPGVYTSQWQLLPPGEREGVGATATFVIEVIDE